MADSQGTNQSVLVQPGVNASTPDYTLSTELLLPQSYPAAAGGSGRDVNGIWNAVYTNVPTSNGQNSTTPRLRTVLAPG